MSGADDGVYMSGVVDDAGYSSMRGTTQERIQHRIAIRVMYKAKHKWLKCLHPPNDRQPEWNMVLPPYCGVCGIEFPE